MEFSPFLAISACYITVFLFQFSFFSPSSNVSACNKVVIRIRPLSSTEISLQGYSKCVRQESCQAITWTGHPESRFTFDIVADERVSQVILFTPSKLLTLQYFEWSSYHENNTCSSYQEKLFKVAGVPMVENCVGGYNSCMFAYGQVSFVYIITF